ncbi:MAG: FkbM family methyltransferase [Verrucomicrobia bacterium]|nr:FkbM family methyltransferase [Verrucomicrobiota bacterium]
MSTSVDSGAIGSDVSRSYRQYWSRKLSKAIVTLFRLNHPNSFNTELIQAIQPVATIKTQHGDLLCKCGHGRLLWRAKTFHTEEPETVRWLDSINQDDCLWDVGANVGLYSVYAARFRKCRVYAFEPESQNFALLVENIALNQVGENCQPACLAISEKTGLGNLRVRYVTKGGAYNLFDTPDSDLAKEKDLPESIKAVMKNTSEKSSLRQMVWGISLDDLLIHHKLEAPTHLKIDVDGLEPWIIQGGQTLLDQKRLRTILIELNKKSNRDMAIPENLASKGFQLASERCNWLSRDDRTKEEILPATNMIFTR